MAWGVLGGGISGQGAARLLLSQGHAVYLYEKNFNTVSFKECAHKNFHIFSDQSASFLEKPIEGLIVSPGISDHHPIIKAAYEFKIPIMSEVDLALQDFPATLFIVTGSNGKSTTSSMISHLLNKEGIENSLAGNIGVSLASLRADKTLKNHIVAELSSYQIEASHRLQADIVIFLSFSSNHLERHGSLRDYFFAKWRAIEFLKPIGMALISKEVASHAKEFGVQLDPRIKVQNHYELETGLPPELNFNHNRINAHFAIRAVESVQQKPLQHNGLCDFQGLPHRFQKFEFYRSKALINDSKATTIPATLAAIKSMGCENFILMVGGIKKIGSDFSELSSHLNFAQLIVAFGHSAKEISSEISSCYQKQIFAFQTLKEASAFVAQTIIKNPAPVLLSPGCPSFDEFQNFEERGIFFQRYMREELNIL